LQGILRVLQNADYGRGQEHDFALPGDDQVEERGGEKEVCAFVSFDVSFEKRGERD